MQDIADAYNSEFQGMTRLEVSFEDLIGVQKTLAPSLVGSLDDNEKTFLLSVKQGEPDWNILGINGLEHMPALQWKLINIRKMDQKKRASALEKLQRILSA